MSNRGYAIRNQVIMLAVGAVVGILLTIAAHAGFLMGVAMAAIMSAIFYFPVLVFAHTKRILLAVVTFFVLGGYWLATAAGEHAILMMIPIIAVPVCVALSIVRAK